MNHIRDELQPMAGRPLPKSRCTHCADQGWAWYYHEIVPTGNRKKRRVWLPEEILKTPKPNIYMSRNAKCSCEAGRNVSAQTGWRTHDGRNIPPTHTTWERIQDLAAERRTWEGVDQT